MIERTFLFFDDKNILSRTGVERKYGVPKLALIYRDPCAVTPTGVPSIWYDEKDSLYHMFYNGYVSNLPIQLAAVSKDGIHWEPRNTAAEAGIAEPEAAHQLLDIRGAELACVYEDRTAPPDQRLKALMTIGDPDAVRIMHDPVYTSGDGIHWTLQPVEWHNHAAEPGAGCFYNAITGKHVITARPDAGVRRVGLIETEDFKTFSDLQLVMTPDSMDEPLAEHYGMPVFPYKDYFVGFLWIFHVPNIRQRKYWGGKLDAQLVYSYNGTHFNRSLREPFLSNDSSPETAGLLIPNALYETRDKKLLIAASIGPHEHGYFKRGGALAIYELRQDGFISFRAEEEGELITIPMVYGGGDLSVNVAAETFSCALYTDNSEQEPMHLLSHDLVPLEGFGHDAFERFSGDSTDHVLRWRSADLQSLKGKVLYLECRMKRGDLYAIKGALTPMMICDLARYHLYGILPNLTGIG